MSSRVARRGATSVRGTSKSGCRDETRHPAEDLLDGNSFDERPDRHFFFRVDPKRNAYIEEAFVLSDREFPIQCRCTGGELEWSLMTHTEPRVYASAMTDADNGAGFTAIGDDELNREFIARLSLQLNEHR